MNAGKPKWLLQLSSFSDSALSRAILVECGYHFSTEAPTDSGAKWHLSSETWEKADGLSDVQKNVYRLSAYFDALPEYISAEPPGLRVGEILFSQDGGETYRQATVSLASSAVASARVSGELTVDGPQRSVEEQESIRKAAAADELARTAAIAAMYLRAAMVEPTLGDVFPLLNGQTTITQAYWIMEKAQSVLGAKFKCLVATSELTRFKRSANSNVYGVESRHGYYSSAPPPNPMTRPEAIAFVRGLIEKWVAHVLQS